MKLSRMTRYGAASLLALGVLSVAQAASTLKIGMVLPMSGPFASYGEQILRGARLYLAQHDQKLADRPVELIVKDDTGVAPERSKRAAQELIVQDKVSILAGFGMTPSAFAVAPLSREAKIPMVVMNAATSSITEKSPYLVRVSMTLPQTTAPLARWAASHGIKTAYTLVADFGPGHDAEKQFVKTFTAAGGKIIGQTRTPVANPDFSPFVQKVKDAHPDAVFLFVPAGEQGVAFLKEYKARGLDKAGIRLISTGDVTDEDVIDAMGDSALGLVTSMQYAQDHHSDLNQAYTAAYHKAYPTGRPNFMSVAGYDGMHLIDAVLKRTGGDANGPKFINAAKGLQLDSPRGPIQIDPDTRDIIQTIYIRKVERVNSLLQNVEFASYPNEKDPGKE